MGRTVAGGGWLFAGTRSTFNFLKAPPEVLAGDSRGRGPTFWVLVLTIGHWQPKIGDPSLAGWFTVWSYYFCAGLSLAYLLKSGRRMDGTVRRFRILITVVLLLLGISKHI